MSRTVSNATYYDRAISQPGTGVMADALLSSSHEHQRRQQWIRLIDHRLVDWGAHPERLGDDDIVAPTPEAVQSAIWIAQTLLEDDEQRVREPDWLVATGDGGIAFRWGQQGQKLYSYECRPTGRVQFIMSENARVISRNDVL